MPLTYEEVLKFKQKALFKQALKDHPELLKKPQFSVTDVFLATEKYILISEVPLDGIAEDGSIVLQKTRYQYVLPWDEIKEVNIDLKRKTLNFISFRNDTVRIYYSEPYETGLFKGGKSMGYENAAFVEQKSNAFLDNRMHSSQKKTLDRAEMFENILKKTTKISLSEITKLLSFDSKEDFLRFVYTLPDHYGLTVDGNNIIFNFEPNRKEETIKSLIKEFQKWDQ